MALAEEFTEKALAISPGKKMSYFTRTDRQAKGGRATQKEKGS